MNDPAIQCLTADGLNLSHEAQVQALCAAGAKWIQLRMKQATDDEVAAVAEACLPVCRHAGCRLIVDDRVESALRVGADGVHLGKRDMAWADARKILGGQRILGGTVNSPTDARAAVASGVLDYVGVGPFRYTRTKEHLAPVLTQEDWLTILTILGPMPAYAIGGIQAGDLGAIRKLGASGVAVCSGLYKELNIAENYRIYAKAWHMHSLLERTRG
ncbi:MAG: thiamine phosphate synthase [Candidatus Latescibacterota bacterium]